MQYEEAVSDWTDAPDTTKSGLPVSDELYIKNVRDNCLLDLPNLGITKDHDKIMVMVCGGPTAKMYLEEIREKSQDDKYVIFSSNKTHDWLISEGIVPDYQFIIDPKVSKIKDVQNPHKDVKYLIGISCDPGVFEALKGYDVTRVYSVSGIGEPSDVEVIRALFPYQDIVLLFGGTMAGLRAMSLADIMGFLTLEYYGFDSCYFDTDEKGEPVYYSYEKYRKENILECQTADGQTFLTSPVFASQARQFIKWRHRYEWIKFIIHGNSLTSVINKIEDEKCRPKHDLLLTDYHRIRNAQLFDEIRQKEQKAENPQGVVELFGTSGHLYSGNIAVLCGQAIKKFGPITLLDYGCGSETLEMLLPPITGLEAKLYDPCIPELSTPPEPADIVVCTDVLEHVEPECLENVLDDLKRLTKKVAFLSISTRRANKSYPDGQNCHLIVEDHDWWRPKLKKRFHVVETQVFKGDKFICILQAKDIR